MVHEARNPYIDFLRGFGLLLLVVAHTYSPEWLFQIRTFDVPLMVFVSGMCYKPLRGGYLAYVIKRFKRIYIPVAVFLTLFFAAEIACHLLFGHPPIVLKTIVGSYLLINSPSIGFVWIMRVFLLAALFIPPLWHMISRMSVIKTLIVITCMIVLQSGLVMMQQNLPSWWLCFFVNEIILYAVGYSVFIILGLKIRFFTNRQLVTTIVILSCAVLGWILMNDGFCPQQYKYPPYGLFLIYGLLGCCVMWILQPVFARFVNLRCFDYLSKNSMWIYLWHILPVFAIARLADVHNFWFCRFLIVLTFAILLNWAYHKLIKLLPEKFSRMIA